MSVSKKHKDISNIYVYKVYEERGELQATVEKMTTGKDVWNYYFPDHDIDINIQSTLVDDGYMKNWNDIEGLRKYLVDMHHFLPQSAIIISEKEAMQKYDYYKKGGLTKKKARMILHEGKAHGRPLSEQQRKFFGARASGYPVKMKNGGYVNWDKDAVRDRELNWTYYYGTLITDDNKEYPFTLMEMNMEVGGQEVPPSYEITWIEKEPDDSDNWGTHIINRFGELDLDSIEYKYNDEYRKGGIIDFGFLTQKVSFTDLFKIK